MRVAGGELKGKKLMAPADNLIRPTSDKVKEAIFNMLMWDVDESVCLDLFCGTGSLGIEAISRGAKYCYFCDSSKTSLSLTRENINACGIADRAELVAGDFKKALLTIGRKIDIALLDPPYNKGLLTQAVELIAENDVLNDEGIIVAEHDKAEILPDVLCGFEKIKEKRYGIIVVTIYKKI